MPPIPVGFGSQLGALFASLASLAALVSEVFNGSETVTVASIVAAAAAVYKTVDGRMKQGSAQILTSNTDKVQTTL